MEPIEAWISAAKDGKADALGKALESFRGYLLAVARREMEPDLLAKGGASDLVQETFLEAYRDFERFEGGDAEALCVWLRGILMHRLANFRRHFRETEKRRITLEVALPARETSEGREFSDRGPTPSRALEQSERSRMLQDAMGRLLEKHRIVLVLRHEKRLTFGEIGLQLGISEEAARKRWGRALERLRQDLEGTHGSR